MTEMSGVLVHVGMSSPEESSFQQLMCRIGFMLSIMKATKEKKKKKRSVVRGWMMVRNTRSKTV